MSTIEPATDELVARFEEGPFGLSSDDILALCARIRAEQTRADTAREQAIRECANVAYVYGPYLVGLQSRIFSLLPTASEITLLPNAGEEPK